MRRTLFTVLCLVPMVAAADALRMPAACPATLRSLGFVPFSREQLFAERLTLGVGRSDAGDFVVGRPVTAHIASKPVRATFANGVVTLELRDGSRRTIPLDGEAVAIASAIVNDPKVVEGRPFPAVVLLPDGERSFAVVSHAALFDTKTAQSLARLAVAAVDHRGLKNDFKDGSPYPNARGNRQTIEWLYSQPFKSSAEAAPNGYHQLTYQDVPVTLKDDGKTLLFRRGDRVEGTLEEAMFQYEPTFNTLDEDGRPSSDVQTLPRVEASSQQLFTELLDRHPDVTRVQSLLKALALTRWLKAEGVAIGGAPTAAASTEPFQTLALDADGTTRFRP